MTGAKIRLPYPKTRYFRLRSEHPEVFKQIASQNKDFPTHEIFAHRDSSAGQAEHISFQSITESLSGAVSKERFLAFCGDPEGIKRQAELQLTEIKARGFVLNEKQQALHGFHQQEDDVITETVFQAAINEGKPTLTLSTTSFLYLTERAVMLTAVFNVSTDKNLDAALGEFRQWTAATVAANKKSE